MNSAACFVRMDSCFLNIGFILLEPWFISLSGRSIPLCSVTKHFWYSWKPQLFCFTHCCTAWNHIIMGNLKFQKIFFFQKINSEQTFFLKSFLTGFIILERVFTQVFQLWHVQPAPLRSSWHELQSDWFHRSCYLCFGEKKISPSTDKNILRILNPDKYLYFWLMLFLKKRGQSLQVIGRNSFPVQMSSLGWGKSCFLQLSWWAEWPPEWKYPSVRTFGSHRIGLVLSSASSPALIFKLDAEM